MAPGKNQSTKAVVSSNGNGNGNGNDNGTGNPNARACARARARGDDAPVSSVSSASSAEVPLPSASAPASSSSSSASASSSASSPVPAPVPSYSAAASTGSNRAGGGGVRWTSAPEQARLKYVHVRAAASYIGVLRSPFFPQDGAAYLAHLASVKARELEKMRARLEAKLSKDAKAKSKSKSKSKSSGGSSSRWALLPVVGVSGGLASCWVPLYHGGGGASGLLLPSSVEHGYHDNDNDNVEGGAKMEGGKAKGKAASAASSSEEAAAAAGTEPSSSSSSSSTSGDGRSGGNEGAPRDNPSNRVNTSVDTLRPSSSSSKAFAAAAGPFDTNTTTSDTPDTTSAANRGFPIRGGFTPPSSPCPPAPRLAPLLKGKTNLTEDFLSVVLAKPNPFNGFRTVKSPDSDDTTSPGPEAAVPFPSAAEYTYEANRRVVSNIRGSQVSPGQPSLVRLRDDAAAAGSGSGHVRFDKRKDKKMKKQKQKWKKEQGKGSKLRAPESVVVPPVPVPAVVWGGPPSRAWPLPRWQGHIRNGDAGHHQNQNQQHKHGMYMDEGYVRHLWSEKLEPHQQFARLRKAELALQKRELVESGIEGLITPPTGRTHRELELMVGAAAQFDFSSSSRQVASAPDLVYHSGLASSVVAEPAHTHTGLSATAVDEPRTSTTVVDAIIAPATAVEAQRAPASAVEAAPITSSSSSSSFSATAIPFVPRSLAPDAPEFVPSSGGCSERDSLSATAEEFVPPSVAVVSAAVVPQQQQSSAATEQLSSLPSSDPPSLVQQQQQQQQQQLSGEESLSSLDPGRVNSWTDYRRDHPRAPRHLRPSQLGHQRNRHQPELAPCHPSAPASPPSVSLGSWTFPSRGSPPRCEPQATAPNEKKTPLPSFDPSCPDFEEEFPPLGQPPTHAHAKAKSSKPSKQQPKANLDAGNHHVVAEDDDAQDIYAASPVLQSASAADVASITTGNNTTGETIEGTISSDGKTGGDKTTDEAQAHPPEPPAQLPPYAAAHYYSDTTPSIYSAEEQRLLLQAYYYPGRRDPVSGLPVSGMGMGMTMLHPGPGPLPFLPVPVPPPAPYPHGYDQPPPGPPHALTHGYGYGNAHGYHHQPPPPHQPLQPLHPQRRVHFADYNTVIHLPPSPWGNGGGVLEFVPQQRPDGAADGDVSLAAAASGFDSHDGTPAFHHDASGPSFFPPPGPASPVLELLPLPAPYNYFSGFSLQFVSAAPAVPAAPAAHAAQVNPQQPPPTFNSGYYLGHHPIPPPPGPPAAPSPGSVPPRPCAPPLFWEILEMVDILDLVEDLRMAGVVEREAEAWQLRAPVGERTWDLSFGDGSGDVEGEGELEEIELEEVSVVVRELVAEIDEFDD
ncbi:hypothetical protein B0H65DRAFT_426627 [Neurospora tetraspora]|uniref:Uncharacterized protein n=1 Tax=Neurospora tetraspora TaxID=94610 RepID=A0AAE0MRW6_9PEZI|nr:hypothetical protein B0H65DRAFT_426627 [Neurospora tetraspora]